LEESHSLPFKLSPSDRSLTLSILPLSSLAHSLFAENCVFLHPYAACERERDHPLVRTREVRDARRVASALSQRAALLRTVGEEIVWAILRVGARAEGVELETRKREGRRKGKEREKEKRRERERARDFSFFLQPFPSPFSHSPLRSALYLRAR
jgi:hypothetical protein